jgi:hypothetical protein
LDELLSTVGVDDLQTDVDGALEEKRVNENRRSEIAILTEMEVFEVVAVAGIDRKLVLGTRMVDTKEKSRFVAKEIARYKTTEFYAPASTSATVRVVDILAAKLCLSRGVLDVRRAFLHVPEDEEIYCVPPEIWMSDHGYEKGSVLWKLRRVLYGRRKAARAWVEYFANILVELGMTRCAAAPQLFKKGSCVAEAHMDDLHFAGDLVELRSIIADIEKKVSIKPAVVIPFGEEGMYGYLRRERRVTTSGCWILPSVDIMRRCAVALGVEEATKVPSTPLASGDRGDSREEDDAQVLTEKEHGLYKAVVGALLHVRLDRQDVAFAVRLAAKRLRSPTILSMIRVKRIVKYVWLTRGLGIFIPNGGGIKNLLVDCDADWAGNRKDRRSNSCAVILISDVVQEFVARGQGVVALSSAESEVYAASTAASQALHVQHLWAWLGYPLRLRLRSDSSAARAILQRQGVGGVRHLSVRILWMQEMTRSGRIVIERVGGEENVADGGTKPLGATRFAEFVERLGLRTSPWRSRGT